MVQPAAGLAMMTNGQVRVSMMILLEVFGMMISLPYRGELVRLLRCELERQMFILWRNSWRRLARGVTPIIISISTCR